MKKHLAAIIILSALYISSVTAVVNSAAPTSSSEPVAGYLFATFRDHLGAMSEQVYFALSKDGVRWTALNDDRPALVSTLGEKGVRDPFLLRAEDGKTFYIIATDLSITLKPGWQRARREGSKSLVIWESTDLVRWSEPRLVEVGPPDAGCVYRRRRFTTPRAGVISSFGHQRQSVMISKSSASGPRGQKTFTPSASRSFIRKDRRTLSTPPSCVMMTENIIVSRRIKIPRQS